MVDHKKIIWTEKEATEGRRLASGGLTPPEVYTILLVDRVLRYEEALEQSIKLQSHYAGLLNMHDGGNRLRFDDAVAWLARLDELKALKARK